MVNVKAEVRQRVGRLAQTYGIDDVVGGTAPQAALNVLSDLRERYGERVVNETLVDELDDDPTAALTVDQARRVLRLEGADHSSERGDRIRRQVESVLEPTNQPPHELSRGACETVTGDGSLAEWVAQRAHEIERGPVDDRGLAFELAWQEAAFQCDQVGVTLSSEAFVVE